MNTNNFQDIDINTKVIGITKISLFYVENNDLYHILKPLIFLGCCHLLVFSTSTHSFSAGRVLSVPDGLGVRHGRVCVSEAGLVDGASAATGLSSSAEPQM